MTPEWPFIGRDDPLARCGASLADPRRHGVVMSGAAGVGRTRLLAECTRLATDSGFEVASATGHRSSAAVPFGALAALLPPMDGNAADAGSMRRAGDALAG